MKNFGKNRKVFFLAVNTGYVKDESPDDRMISFYKKRSGRDIFCAIVGNVVTPNGAGSNNYCAKISKNKKWSELADEISSQGTIPGLQISSTWPGYTGIKKFIPDRLDESLNEYKKIANSFTTTAVESFFEDFSIATEYAVAAGFRHIQLHAAHGYLLNMLIDPRLCQHSTKVQGLIKYWALGLKKIDIQTSIRFSAYSGHPSLDSTNSQSLEDQIIDIPVDYFDVSAGYYNIDKKLIYPTASKILARRHKTTLELAQKNPGKNFIISGKSAKFLEIDTPENISIGLCRDLIANPDFLKSRSISCENCGKCHYHSRGVDSLECGIWS